MPSVFVVAHFNGLLLVGYERRHRAYGFPGGKVEVHETAMEAAAREFAEEVLGTPALGELQAHFDEHATLAPSSLQDQYVLWQFPTANEERLRDTAVMTDLRFRSAGTVRALPLRYPTAQYLRHSHVTKAPTAALGVRFDWFAKLLEVRAPVEITNVWSAHGAKMLLDSSPCWVRRKRDGVDRTHKDDLVQLVKALGERPKVMERYEQPQVDGRRYGRLRASVPRDDLSIAHCNLKSDTREAVTGKPVVDLDMASCFDSILLCLMEDHGLASSAVWQVSTRKAHLLHETQQLFGCTRKSAKRLFLKVMFDDDAQLVRANRLQRWAAKERLSAEGARLEALRLVVDAYGPEMLSVRDALLAEHPFFLAITKGRTYNQRGSAFSHLLQSIENELLHLFTSFVRDSGLSVVTLMWDGCYVHGDVTEAWLQRANEHVAKATGWQHVRFETKGLTVQTPLNTLGLSVPEANGRLSRSLPAPGPQPVRSVHPHDVRRQPRARRPARSELQLHRLPAQASVYVLRELHEAAPGEGGGCLV
jgi:ADP-ribose pyrophosphatase YjhB (NUDIX family)